MYKLSICIPTYNRAKYLAYLLDSIIKQVDATNPIEICISDNASTDNTQELVQQYQKQYPHIVYFCWAENMGPDRNFLQVVDIAHGEYCWLMGSDDAVVAGGVAKVLQAIQQDNVDICMVNRIVCDIEMRPMFKLFLLDKKTPAKRFNLHDDDGFIQYSYYAKSMKANAINAFFSYLSMIIFKKSMWNEVAVDESLIGTAYIHAFKLLSFVKKHCYLYYLPDCVVYFRAYNDCFFEGDAAKRRLLDFTGYEKITNVLFKDDPLRKFCVLNVLVKDLNLKARLHMVLFSPSYNLAAFYAVYQGMFGRPILFGIDKIVGSLNRILSLNKLYMRIRIIYRKSLRVLFKIKK